VRIIAFINQKGGVGKTTSTINVGAGLTRLDRRVLLVDLDPQANLTYSLGLPAHTLTQTLYELLHGSGTRDQVTFLAEKMQLIPANARLAAAEIEFSGHPGREYMLKRVLESLDGYDYVLLDCPPGLGLLTLNGLTSAQTVYIPLQPEFLALRGLSNLVETVEMVRERLNPVLKIGGILATRYDPRRRLNREVVEKIRAHFGQIVFQTLIRENIALAEAPSFGKSIFSYRPGSHGAEDYLRLCEEILERNAHEKKDLSRDGSPAADGD
jgi:chromosome partitioning protein